MFGRKKVDIPEQPKEKPIPAFLSDNYPYKAVGEALRPEDCRDGLLYEIKCHACETSIRSQGQNTRATWERMKDTGCISCGNKELNIYKVDMSGMKEE